ncbi:MAG TPA: transporter substrate-binding domain-containing protein [Candidatus Competibacteraceae bacterium]|nr:transporter substrate-binding domain-containing protein [Candidatus Competibacteraceae bacterium]MCP5134969.1 transporter substrate-binding domain-containing protein [Gammaproteobacteria bacterium]HPF58571.1 transporter substrate-binding domain-containing protein [Candidatus Competibacteraceae bacterium]HRY18288.1 transporter substrate-binding domain-containing protein [Candidatus Competibacteraceae bacterium]
MKNRLFAALTAAVLALTLLLPSLANAQKLNQQLAAGSVLEIIKKRGSIKVGMSTFVPWAMRDKNGGLTGYEIDVAKKLAEDMGVKAEFVPTAWDGIIPALLAGKFDIIIAGMSITPERNLTVNFSLPYANSGIQMVASKKLAAGLSTLEDFDKPEIVLAVRRGATPATAAKRLMPKATLRQFDEDALALQEVLNEKAHAFVTSTPTPAFEVLKHPGTLFLPIPEPFVQGAEGFALRKGDPDALNFFNNWILLRQQDGWLKERHDYWFKTRDWAGQVME